MSFIASERAAEAIGPERLDMLRALPDLAIGAIAGRDSLAAIVAAVRGGEFSAVLPTSVATGTEYGDTDAPLDAVRVLRETLADVADVLDPVRIGSPEMWAAINGHVAAEVFARWRLHSPCLACHLYVHLARVPLSWALGGVPIITGERDSHDGRVKLSQSSAAIDAEIRVLAYAGVELLAPVRHASGADLEAIIPDWDADARQLCCVHSGNYRRLDGTVQLDPVAYAAYVREFVEPVGRAIVDEWRGGQGEWDYDGVVRSVLAERPARESAGR